MAHSASVEFVRVPAGSVVFSQGESGGCAYVVISGQVAVEREVGGCRIRLAVLGANGLFGEMGAFDGGVRSATAVALEATTLSVVPAEVVRHKIDACDPFVRGMIALLVHNLRHTDAQVERTPESVQEVLRHLLSCSGHLHRIALNECGDSAELEIVARHLDNLDAAINLLAGDMKRVGPHGGDAAALRLT